MLLAKLRFGTRLELRLLVAVFVSALSMVSNAQDTIRLGQISFGGDGCPAGTASSTVSPDGQALSILFDRFTAQAGHAAGSLNTRRSCNLSIPVLVPNGYAVGIFSIDYRGFVDAPPGGRTQLNVEYFFAGSQGPVFRRTFDGPTSTDYIYNNTLQTTSIAWSGCGENVILRTNANIVATSNGNGDMTTMTVDSADVQSGVRYHVRYRSCDPNGEKRAICDIRTFNGDVIQGAFHGTRFECQTACQKYETTNPYRQCRWNGVENLAPRAQCELRTWVEELIIPPFEASRGECYGRCLDFETPNPWRSCRWNGTENLAPKALCDIRTVFGDVITPAFESSRGECATKCMKYDQTNPARSCMWNNQDNLAPRGSCTIKTYLGDLITPIFQGTRGDCYKRCADFDSANPYRMCLFNESIEVARTAACEIRSANGSLLTPVFESSKGNCLRRSESFKGSHPQRSCRWGSDVIPNDLFN